MLSDCGNRAQVGLLADQIRCITDSSDNGAFPKRAGQINGPVRLAWDNPLPAARWASQLFGFQSGSLLSPFQSSQ
jgi:hypothetical protein